MESDWMLRLIGITFSLAACMFFSGCMGMACYRGAGISCNNCDGYSRDISSPPLRRMASNVACGSGCGDVYVGEWRNYGPNHCDPCESRGGCRPFMGALSNLFGYRDVSSQTCYGGDRQFFGMVGNCVTDVVCGCDTYGCSGCSDGYFDGGCASGSCGGSIGGCSGCDGCALPVSPRSNSVGSRSPVGSQSQVAGSRSNTRPVFRNGGMNSGAGNYIR